jgi:D-lyxose ketol-isomerase
LVSERAGVAESFGYGRAVALRMLEEQGIAITADERRRIEVTDFGLGRLREIGLQLLTYVNTDRCCAKELLVLPGQLCPEHLHPSLPGAPGKEETFRCRAGTVWLNVPGEPTPGERRRSHLPAGYDRVTAWHEIELRPGDQFTIPPDTPHWFQAGPEGAVVTEFSTRSDDATDRFTDPDVRRLERVDSW